ncbi:tryptophan transporter [Clostridium sp. DJ247]|nr:tryptophan transporter [Clostridium sp. DJ247]
MKIKKVIINSLFLAIGAVLHQIAPPLLFGMRPDFSLAMLFIILVLNDDYKTCLISGVVAGILAAAATSFPGGQLANIVDKFVTTNIMFFLIQPLRNINIMFFLREDLSSRLNNQIKIILTTAIGTIISGTAFLSVAFLTAGLPGKFSVLFIGVVLPGCLINTIVAAILFNALNIAIKRGAIKGM